MLYPKGIKSFIFLLHGPTTHILFIEASIGGPANGQLVFTT
jgi:hypothetical protein